MKEMRRRLAALPRHAFGAVALALAVGSLWALSASAAMAGVGYEADTVPSFSLGNANKAPHGIAVDQSSHRIYVAIVSNSPSAKLPGEVDRFESNFSQSGTFTAGTNPLFAGVAVDPITGNLYAAQAVFTAGLESVGSPVMNVFTSGGSLTKTFNTNETKTIPHIVTDATGSVYFPNAFTNTVQVYNSAGSLQKSISCTGCPGGGFDEPVSVALTSSNDLYVVDLEPNRVVKLTLSGGSYTYASTLQSGQSAGAVAVDSTNNDVFVGGLTEADRYHVIAYDSTGTQFDDFGAGSFAKLDGGLGLLVAGQMAIDLASRRLYVSDLGEVQMFARVASIKTPQATIEPATPVTQLTATLRATLNARGHAALDCVAEFTDEADFQANGFDDATDLACPKNPDGTSNVPLDAKVSSLDPGTGYRYRVKLTTNAGTTTSATESFTTLPSVAPTVTTNAPTGVTQTGATFKGKVNPNGGTVSSCRFEYGTTTSYGLNLACTNLPGPVTTEVAQSRAIGGLTTGATYHYRLAVTSNAGTSTGQDASFVAVNPPSPIDEESPPVGSSPPLTLPALPPTVNPPRRLKCKKGFVKKRVRGKLKCVKRRAAKRRARR